MRRVLGIAVLAVVAAIVAAPAAAQPRPAPPVYFKADSLRYDRELGIIVATGNVEFTREDRVLLADTVSYNEKSETVTASGKVRLLEPTGEVVFADYVELTGDLKEGVIRDLRMRLQDDSRMAANAARRTGGTRTELAKAVYSPCDVCADRPDRAPLWQLKARRVVHDQETHDIVYHDAVLEMFGIPVAYTPYLEHPDPTVERRSGFLAPTFGNDSELGSLVRTPIYYDIAPDKDATVEPIMTTNEGPVLAGEYRERFRRGIATVAGSLTRASAGSETTKTRGHVRGLTRFDLDPTWRAGADLYRATDDTYLRRYGFDSRDVLTSQAFVEGFRGRNYAAFNAYAFQGLRATDDPGTTPLVWPLAWYSYVGQPSEFGQRWTLDANAMQLTRSDGTDSRRLSVTPGWRLPVTTRSGEVYTLFATVQNDLYVAGDVVDPRYPLRAPQDVTTGRVFPQVGIDWRYPFIRRDATTNQILEPIAGFVAAPNVGSSWRIPNEDSLDFELQDSNIFEANRFTGIDRVEGGQRVYYGLRASVIGTQRDGSASAFLGQSYRLRNDDTFPRESGLDAQLSDVVGRLQVSPAHYLDLLYRFRLDKDDLDVRRHEVGFTAGPRALVVGLNYIFIGRRPDEIEFRTRNELQGVVVARLTPAWSAGGHFLRDMGDDGGQLRHGFSLSYEDECFVFSTDYIRTFTQDRDVRPSTTIMFRLAFKTLGRVEFGG